MIDKHTLSLALLQWHGGQGTGLYAVGSCLLAGHEPDLDSVRRAIDELRNMKRDANYPENVTRANEKSCKRMADILEAYYPEAKQ